MEKAIPVARDAYYGAFDGLSLTGQLRIQANAERQGAAAWRSLAAGQEDARVCEALEAWAGLEETSADHVDRESWGLRPPKLLHPHRFTLGRIL